MILCSIFILTVSSWYTWIWIMKRDQTQLSSPMELRNFFWQCWFGQVYTSRVNSRKLRRESKSPERTSGVGTWMPRKWRRCDLVVSAKNSSGSKSRATDSWSQTVAYVLLLPKGKKRWVKERSKLRSVKRASEFQPRAHTLGLILQLMMTVKSIHTFGTEPEGDNSTDRTRRFGSSHIYVQSSSILQKDAATATAAAASFQCWLLAASLNFEFANGRARRARARAAAAEKIRIPMQRELHGVVDGRQRSVFAAGQTRSS